MSADESEPCASCCRPVDPNDAAPSCGSHALDVACYETADFDCRECLRVRRELDDEEFGKWVGSGWAS